MYKENKKFRKSKKILFFSFNFLPDQSPGSTRTKLLVKKLNEIERNLKIIIICSIPRRFGKNFTSKDLKKEDKVFKDKNIKIFRIWIPFFGQGPLASLISYLFYFVQAGILSLFIKPDITFATSAKLLTALLASLSSNLNGSKLFIDIRDIFTDNFFYFYRWNKRILLFSIIIILENIVIRSAYSINLISSGFNNAYLGWESILKRKSIKVTNFTNGYYRDFTKSEKIDNNKLEINNNFYKIVYAGNVGAGQDLLSLIKCLSSNPKILEKMVENKICFEIYGLGTQLKKIEQFIATEENYLLQKFLFLKGLIPKKNVKMILNQADCLLLNLNNYNPVSMVIPSKIFEYAATNLPIVFCASGFTFDFISKIEGTISYEFSNASSFYSAIEKSRKSEINSSKREKFLKEFDSEVIYENYAKHILGRI